MSIDEAVQAFSHSHHRNFPVVENGKLVGLVTQKDLVNTGSQQLARDTSIDRIMTPEPVTVGPTATLAWFCDELRPLKGETLQVCN